MKKKAAKKKTASKKAGKKKGASKKTPPKKKKAKGTVIITGPKVSDEHVKAKNGATVSFEAKDAAYTLTFNAPPVGDNDPWPFVESPDARPGNTATIDLQRGAPKRTFTMRATVVHGQGGYGYSIQFLGGPRPGPEVVPDP